VNHGKERRFEDGIHLALRSILCSPQFLYRAHRDGPLDDYDLAARLSYFLWSMPPDKSLLASAQKAQLRDPQVRATTASRMLAKRPQALLDPFLDQWLDLKLLANIMPDERLQRWNDKDRATIEDETRLFVAEILRDNLPLATFIDPDFTYLNARNAKLYGRRDIKGDAMRRVSLPKGGRFGGLLGQASIMMATANGVDTQPVLRGVWLAENIVGRPPPPPPDNVPAIEPDTGGATTIREQLARHQADPSCAGCHAKIDPLGFALESFDPIGRWRETYPSGQAVDSRAVLPDGSILKDVTDLKRHLVADIDGFAECLAEKLLTYATGREMSYGDRLVIQRIVRDLRKSEGGFRDLIVALVASEAFAVR
jgi:hypothetical protein